MSIGPQQSGRGISVAKWLVGAYKKVVYPGTVKILPASF